MTEINIDKDIKLRSWSIDDLESLVEIANNYSIWQNMRDEFPYPYTITHGSNWLSQIAIPNFDTYLAIFYKDSLAGEIHVKIHDDIRRYSGVISYWIGEKYWNKGIATQVIRSFTDYVFKQLNLLRLYAKIFSSNIGSIRAIEKAGYIKEGHLKNAIVKENKIIDQVLYAIINEAHSPNNSQYRSGRNILHT